MNLDPGTADMTADDWHARYGSEHERIAPTCPGPGHLIGTDERGFDVRIEDCPECIGRGPRNHRTVRLVAAT